MVNGYENCYLKSSTGGTVPNQNGITFATRHVASNSPTSDTPFQNYQASKAWVAGPVIGGVILVAVALAALWWCRKKRRVTRNVQSSDSNPEEEYIDQSSSSRPEEGYIKTELETPINAPRFEMEAAAARPLIELESTAARGVRPRES
jgi:hypothetical protein